MIYVYFYEPKTIPTSRCVMWHFTIFELAVYTKLR